jgi:poly-gamma-glutamate synthesis protein (capsule biosynthesis protein)
MKIQQRHGVFLAVFGVVVLAGITFLCLLVFLGGGNDERSVVNITTPEEIVPDPVATGGNTKILMAGTVFWGRRTNKLARASELGVTYPFSELDSLERDEYDAWISGLECPITDNGHTDYNENTLLKFNCDPDYLPEAAKWFSAFMLGTNHTDNWGVEGFEATKANLDEAGFQYFGHYDRSNDVDNCGVLVLPVRVGYDDNSEKEMHMPFGFCSAHGVYGVPPEAALQNIKRYAEVLPTIVMPHMGAEYKTSADALRTNLFRKMIDYGADMVIADHPHWIQNTEAYNGRLIVYSMGNFMFDQLFNAEVVRSAAIEAHASFDEMVDFEAWDKLGRGCLKDKLSCFEKIELAELPKIQIGWEFDYRGATSANNCKTRLASEAEQVAIGQRLNWAVTLAGLR